MKLKSSKFWKFLIDLEIALRCLFWSVSLQADIETYNVDIELNKVIVTGNVTTEEVIRVIQKIGKTATAWDGDQTNS